MAIHIYTYIHIGLFKEKCIELEHLERSEKNNASDLIR